MHQPHQASFRVMSPGFGHRSCGCSLSQRCAHALQQMRMATSNAASRSSACLSLSRRTGSRAMISTTLDRPSLPVEHDGCVSCPALVSNSLFIDNEDSSGVVLTSQHMDLTMASSEGAIKAKLLSFPALHSVSQPQAGLPALPFGFGFFVFCEFTPSLVPHLTYWRCDPSHSSSSLSRQRLLIRSRGAM
jgi:hypothetical protein